LSGPSHRQGDRHVRNYPDAIKLDACGRIVERKWHEYTLWDSARYGYRQDFRTETKVLKMGPSNAVETEKLVELCQEIRAREGKVTDEHVMLLERLASETREVREANPGATSPPSDQARRLRIIGWLMYEVSLKSLQNVPAAWESLLADNPLDFETAEKYDSFIDSVANSARFLAWREFSPRALGAIRAQAVASSKRDTDAGYARAWLFHREADFLHDLYRGQVADDPKLKRAYLESLVQLRLAETGTACRTAEFAISLQYDRHVRSTVPERARINKLFRDLEAGAKYGDEAIDKVDELRRDDGLVQAVDEHGIALDTSYRQPGIMTARAYLLMYPVTALLEKQGRRTWQNLSTWGEAMEKLLEGFVKAYRAIETDSSKKEFTPEQQRSIVQLRLNLAFVCPGFPLSSELSSELEFDPCLKQSVLDADAVEQLSHWLASNDQKGKQRGDANVIGSATMPSYLESIRLVLDNDDDWKRYVTWRRTSFDKLDRYATDEGRNGRVMAALDATAT
jgi:hypothetical protein